MSAHTDGGPAFPHKPTRTSTMAQNLQITTWGDEPGMTLRDYFAAKAMQAQVTTDMVPGEACDALVDAAALAGQDPTYRLALNSYLIADAMLKARSA